MKRKPIAWIGNVKFIRKIPRGGKQPPQELVHKIKCLIWKPELFEPKLTTK